MIPLLYPPFSERLSCPAVSGHSGRLVPVLRGSGRNRRAGTMTPLEFESLRFFKLYGPFKKTFPNRPVQICAKPCAKDQLEAICQSPRLPGGRVRLHQILLAEISQAGADAARPARA